MYRRTGGVIIASTPRRETRTRFEGVFARHRSACARSADLDARCTCQPSYFGTIWDRNAGKTRKTRRFDRPTEARAARADMLAALRSGELVGGSRLSLADARDRFVGGAAEGIALNKHGRRYRASAVTDLRSSLAQLPSEMTRRRLGDVGRGDVQALVDTLVRRGLSGSRVRSIVNALRSLYRWAIDRELAPYDPAALVRLPAMNPTPRDRVAAPAEFAKLLKALALEDALPWALAGYAGARSQEIRRLDWQHVNLKTGVIELAGDEEARKPGGSWRVVPLVKPLRAMLRRAWIAQGRPKRGRVCPPRRRSASGLLSLNQLQKGIVVSWEKLGLDPIRLHESRHTFATWLDHAGISPAIASQLMGHRTPAYQPGAARITLDRYNACAPGRAGASPRPARCVPGRADEGCTALNVLLGCAAR